MRIVSKKSKLFCLWMAVSLSTYAQYNDACLWAGLTIEKKLAHKAYLLFSPQIRFDNNYTDTDKLFADIGFGVKPIKNLEFELMYRCINSRSRYRTYELQHRLFADLSYKVKKEKWMVTNRVRYQNQYEDFNRSENWNIPVSYLRNRLTVKLLPENKLQPFLFGDIWFAFNNINNVTNIRYGLGVDYEINKYQGISVAYFIDEDVQVNNPATRFVLSLNYQYKF